MNQLGTAAVAAGLSNGALRLLRRYPPVAAQHWNRLNYAGHPVSLLEGPALVFAAAAAAAVCVRPRPIAVAAASAAVGAGLAGLIDDLSTEEPVEGAPIRGFAGHLGALRHGRVTTGVMKLAAIGAAGLCAGSLAHGADVGGTRSDRLITGGLVAGMANLVNLFDLRPGRAGKVGLLVALPVALSGNGGGAQLGAGAAGAIVGVLPSDLAGHTMAGDTGANALGAMLGMALAARLPPRRRVAAFTAIAALTAASEIISFGRVIDAVRPLRWLDRLGRADGRL